jgi:hypothetical protein
MANMYVFSWTDIPLTTFQAQFNEALIAMYAGFHPDSWWVSPADEVPNVAEASGNEDEAPDRFEEE